MHATAAVLETRGGGFDAAYPLAREEILMGLMARGRTTLGIGLAVSRHRPRHLIGYNKESNIPMGRKIGNACVRSSGRFGVSDCRRGLFEEPTAIAMLKVYRMRYQEFCERFGRDPEPDEPLFFDPTQEPPVAPEPAVIRSQVMAAALAARVDPQPILDFVRVSRHLGPATPLLIQRDCHRTVPKRDP